MLDYNGTRASDVIVVNFGGHYHHNPKDDARFKADVAPILDAMGELGDKATVVWRWASVSRLFVGGVRAEKQAQPPYMAETCGKWVWWASVASLSTYFVLSVFAARFAVNTLVAQSLNQASGHWRPNVFFMNLHEIVLCFNTAHLLPTLM